jgi:hypothetical protein
MNRKQIKQKREFHERQIDDLMSRGYGGSEDENFKRACEQCSKHEAQLKLLAAAADEINAKSRNARRTNKYVKQPAGKEMFS